MKMEFTLSKDQEFFIMASTIVQEPSTISVLHTCTSSVSKGLCLVTSTQTVLFGRVCKYYLFDFKISSYN